MIKPKFKHNIIKPEDVVEGCTYSFSYNPEEQPKPQRFYNISLSLFKSWSDTLNDIFNSFKYCKFHHYMEISSNSRLHFHGYIKINNISKFYFYEIQKLKHYGTFEIDFITDPLIWDLYIKKQKSFMEIFCSENEMTYEYTSFEY